MPIGYNYALNHLCRDHQTGNEFGMTYALRRVFKALVRIAGLNALADRGMWITTREAATDPRPHRARRPLCLGYTLTPVGRSSDQPTRQSRPLRVTSKYAWWFSTMARSATTCSEDWQQRSPNRKRRSFSRMRLASATARITHLHCPHGFG